MNINPSVNLQAAVMSFNNVTMAIKTNGGDDDDDVEASRSQMKRPAEEIFFSPVVVT